MPEETKPTPDKRSTLIREKIAAGLDPMQAAQVVRDQEAWDDSEAKKAMEAEEADRLKRAAKAAKT